MNKTAYQTAMQQIYTPKEEILMKAKELQAQLKQIMSSDQAYLDSTDRLFQQLGL